MSQNNKRKTHNQRQKFSMIPKPQNRRQNTHEKTQIERKIGSGRWISNTTHFYDEGSDEELMNHCCRVKWVYCSGLCVDPLYFEYLKPIIPGFCEIVTYVQKEKEKIEDFVDDDSLIYEEGWNNDLNDGLDQLDLLSVRVFRKNKKKNQKMKSKPKKEPEPLKSSIIARNTNKSSLILKYNFPKRHITLDELQDELKSNQKKATFCVI